jgi:hypothetical protein
MRAYDIVQIASFQMDRWRRDKPSEVDSYERLLQVPGTNLLTALVKSGLLTACDVLWIDSLSGDQQKLYAEAVAAAHHGLV